MATINKQWLLASRPAAEATVGNFRLVETPVPALAEGQVLVRHHYLSLDPYMRMRMNDAKSYAAPQPLNAVMIGGTVGEVVDSKHPKFAAGDKVVGMGGPFALRINPINPDSIAPVRIMIPNAPPTTIRNAIISIAELLTIPLYI